MKLIFQFLVVFLIHDQIIAQSLPGDTSIIRHRYPRVVKRNSKNLIPNASFEAGTDGWSTQGIPTGWGGDFWSLYGRLDKRNRFEGKHSFRIDLGENKTPVTYYDVWPSQKKLQLAPLTANRGWIDVIPGEQYTLSVYMKCSRENVPGMLVVFQAPDLSQAIKPVADTQHIILKKHWNRYSFTFTALDKQMFIAAGPNLASNDIATSVWIDAFQLEKGNQVTSFTHYENVEIGFETNKFGNIFNGDEKSSISLTGYSLEKNNSAISIVMNITDYFDRKVGEYTKLIKLVPGVPFKSEWPLHLPGIGYYKLHFSWIQNGVTHTRNFPIALIDRYTEADSPFGINHAPTTENACKALQQVGITWARNWSINWGFLEPKEKLLSFELSDAQIDRDQQVGFNTLALLPPLPSTNWNSTAPDTIPATLWYRSAYMPRNKNLLMEFMSKAVNHYQSRIKVWEFLNEPIWTKFCLPGKHYGLPGSDYLPHDYTTLLRDAYATIKSADPSSTVIGGFSAEPWRYTKDFILSGGLQYVDILNIHNYGEFMPPEVFVPQMDSLLSYMDQYGSRKPIWITEYAYYAADELPWAPWNPPANYSAANLLLKNEKQCADWTIRYNVIMLAKGVNKLFYHQGQDGQLNNSVVNLECPLLNDFAEPRKLYAAQGALSNMLGSTFTFSGTVENNLDKDSKIQHHIQTYGFQCAKRSVVVGWVSEKEKNKITIQLPDGVEVFDIMGNKIQTANHVILGNSPVYIVSSTKNIADLLFSCNIDYETNTR